MTTVFRHSIVVGLMFAWGCGDSRKEPAADRTAAPPQKTTVASKPADLCALLTQAEAETIHGKELGPPQRQPGGDCWYGPGEIVLSVLPVRIGSKREFDAFVDREVKNMNESMKKAGGKESAIEPVSDLGAPAYFVDPSLFVFQGNRVLAATAVAHATGKSPMRPSRRSRRMASSAP